MNVETWIEFGRGPLFRLAFALMVLGLLRIFFLTLAGMAESYRRNMDRIVPWGEVARQTAAWLLPAGRFWRRRPVYGAISLIFHVGLLIVPLFLAAHVLLWKQSVGFAWPAIPLAVANWLTLLVIAAGLGLLGGRVFYRGARKLSRPQDFVWPLLLVIPFATGYVCANTAVRPSTYQVTMFLHVYSADAIMLMIPFTKLAHCVLVPLSQAVTAVAWKFPPGAGDRVAATLGYADRPSWVAGARLQSPARAADDEVCAK
jgi:nitrate reductase gamma subunit